MVNTQCNVRTQLDMAQDKYDRADAIYNAARMGFDAGSVDRAELDHAYQNVEETFSELKRVRYHYVMLRAME